MKKSLTSPDIRELVSDWQPLVGSRVDQFGRPDGEKMGLKTYFLTIQDENFVNDFKKLSISQDCEILSICKSGERSQFVAELLTKENYKRVNISDGFDGWNSSDLPLLLSK